MLIIDDDRETVLELADLLSSSDLVFTGYTDAAVALERLDRDRPPIGAFVDLMMPRMNGIEFIRVVRSLPAPANAMPIVVFTGADDDRLQMVAEKLDVLRVLHKPSSYEELSDALDAMRKAAGTKSPCSPTLAAVAEIGASEEDESGLKLQLALALKLRDDFIDLVNHELRNPLNGILGAAELIRLRAGEMARHEVLQMANLILESGQQLLAHFEAVMELSGEDRRGNQHPVGRTSAGKIVDAAMARVRVPEGAAITVPGASAGTDPLILGREKRLAAAVAAVVDNALRFSAHPPRVDITVKHDSEVSTIVVSDRGIGMTREECAVAFDIFRQIDTSRSRRNYGLGVGLPLAQKYLEEQGGTIHLESIKGVGTTVTMTIPHRPPDAGQPASVPKQ